MKRQRIGRPPKVTRSAIHIIRRSIKLRRSLTDQALAKRLGISASTVKNIAAGYEPKRFAAESL